MTLRIEPRSDKVTAQTQDYKFRENSTIRLYRTLFIFLYNRKTRCIRILFCHYVDIILTFSDTTNVEYRHKSSANSLFEDLDLL